MRRSVKHPRFTKCIVNQETLRQQCSCVMSQRQAVKMGRLVGMSCYDGLNSSRLFRDDVCGSSVYIDM
jgi:hypothetical protein